jgi:hypothetical protein
MHDWQALLREKLGRVLVSPERLDEIVSEIAAHLNQAWQDAENAGAPVSRDEFVRAQVGDIAQLRDRIERIENRGTPVHERHRHFWMPAFVAMVLAQSITLVGQIMTNMAVFGNVSGNYFSYMVHPGLLLLVGGLAALVARRRGATRLCSFLAVTVSALLMYVPSWVGYALAVHTRPWLRNRSAFYSPYFLLLPAICLSLGALLFSMVVPRKQVAQ